MAFRSTSAQIRGDFKRIPPKTMAITIIIIEVGEFFNPYSARPEKRPFGRISLNNHFEKLAFGPPEAD